MVHGVLRAHRRIVRWAFERLYREFAWTYDGVAWLVSRGLWLRWGRAALPYLRGRVLELGFGPGHLQLALAARPGPPPAGLDASPQMVARAARRLRHAGRPAGLARGLAQAIPFRSACFDSVVTTFPADYILDQRSHQEIGRVLAPGGRLVVVDSARLAGSGFYECLVALAYRLTLQTPADRSQPAQPRLEPGIAGLTASTYWEIVGPSQVAVIVAEPAATDPAYTHGADD